MSRLFALVAFVALIQILTGCARRDPAKLNRDLIEAAKAGDRTGVESLLKEGASVEARNESHRTVLMLAALKGNKEVVTVLLDHGANVNATDSQGMTPLMWAAFGGVPEVVRVLIDHHADIAAKDHNGEAAVKWARPSNIGVLDLLRNPPQRR